MIVRGGGTYTRFGYSFTGGGTRHADSAQDEYVGGYATVGYVY
jgi:hypothetical protein